ncbi:hypothetical protein FW778_06280 [Ginsengibacter hankyongi]|uniref:Acyltransferase n=2 Tax=Ginsengibacter hankyongi TaxID=2607284 RepID=A0A5J5IKL1_9BACT|nr:hypothetical protein FW778_06280 [Ginsengibacter hankyongi]
MNFISKISRFILSRFHSVLYFLRIVRLKLLYPGITIDFKTRIEGNCSIVCIKGGRLIISNSKISFGTNIIADTGSILLIDQSFIGRNCVITAKKKVMINKNCLIAEMVVIRDQDHITKILNGKHKQEEFVTAPVEIAENVWIGAKASILKGIQIGEFSVIAASAVVTKSVPSFQVWAGIPAKFMKQVTTTD